MCKFRVISCTVIAIAVFLVTIYPRFKSVFLYCYCYEERLVGRLRAPVERAKPIYF